MKYIFPALLIFFSAKLYTAQDDTVKIPPAEITFSAEADLCSSYIYRGIILNRNFVTQSGITAYYGNFSLGAWCNVNSVTKASPFELSETDLFISHDITLFRIDITNTAAMYIYPGADYSPTTAEYTLGASYSRGPFQYFSNFTVDIMEYSGAYIFTHGIGYEKELSGKLQLNTSFCLAWAGSKYNAVNTGLEKTALDYAGFDLSLTYSPSENFYFKPHFQFNRVIDKDLHEYIDKQSSSFGILTGYTF